MRLVDPVDERLTGSGEHREDPEVELVDESVRDQRSVELAGSEFEDVPAAAP